MRAPHLSLPALAVLAFATGAIALSVGCGESDTVGQSFENLGGSGGNGTGGDEQGGSGTGAGTTTSTSTSTSTTSTSTSTSSTTTTTSTTTGPTCDDTGAEPNDSEANATNLGTINDNDASGESVSGVLDGPADVDWYKYNGIDDLVYTVDPSRTVSFAMPARVCKYAQCSDAAAAVDVTCPGSTTAATSPDGRPGCCSGNGFEMDVDCPGVDDDTTIYIRIDNPNGSDCIPYSIDYHY